MRPTEQQPRAALRTDWRVSHILVSHNAVSHVANSEERRVSARNLDDDRVAALAANFNRLCGLAVEPIGDFLGSRSVSDGPIDKPRRDFP
jgi:hypothetical protein